MQNAASASHDAFVYSDDPLHDITDIVKMSTADIPPTTYNAAFFKMECKHTNSNELQAPSASQSVYREDCTQCFGSIVSLAADLP